VRPASSEATPSRRVEPSAVCEYPGVPAPSDPVASRPRALLLDLDDTLLDGDAQRDAVAATCRVLAGLRRDLDAASLLQANDEAAATFFTGRGQEWALGRIPTDELRREIWSETLGRCGCLDDELVTLAARSHEHEARVALRLYPDARELLFGGRVSLPFAMVTNGASDVQREKLAVLGIEPRFTAIIVSGEAGVAKPDPAVFSLALDALSVDAEDAWHVGDNLRMDVRGANAAGLTSVWLNRGGRPVPEASETPDVEIRSLAELEDLLAI
jgi:putative hydrolase of the HAD superfamily